MFHAQLVEPLPRAIEGNARRFGDRVAYSDDRRSVRFAELADRTERLGGHLTALVARGEKTYVTSCLCVC